MVMVSVLIFVVFCLVMFDFVFWFGVYIWFSCCLLLCLSFSLSLGVFLVHFTFIYAQLYLGLIHSLRRSSVVIMFRTFPSSLLISMPSGDALTAHCLLIYLNIYISIIYSLYFTNARVYFHCFIIYCIPLCFVLIVHD